MEAKLAYSCGMITLQEPIIVRLSDMGRLRTTIGRLIFNEILPEKLRFVNEVVDKGKLKKLVRKCMLYYSKNETVVFLD